MELNNNQSDNINKDQQEEISIVEIFFHYLRYWKWFLLSIGVCLLMSFLYLKYATRNYKIQSLVLIKDDQKGRPSMDFNAFADLGIVAPTNNFDNEIQLLLSNNLMQQVIDSLKIYVSYYKQGKVKYTEIYKSTPIFVYISLPTYISGSFVLDKKDDDNYSLYSDEDEFSATFKIGDEVSSPWGILTFEKNQWETTETLPIVVEILRKENIPLLTVAPVNKTSNVAEISLTTPTPQKGIDIINTLISIYNQRAIDEKNYVANRTVAFIDERLSIISGELKSAEVGVEGYKRSTGLTDITAEAQLFLTASNEYSKKISDTETQLSLLRSVKAQLLAPEHDKTPAPSNLGLTDPTILSLIQKYNEEIIAKERNTSVLTASNPITKDYDKRISLMRENLIKGISIAESGMQTTLKELRRQENSYITKTQGLSTQERQYRELYRQKEIKESLFVYLLQKREETGLSLALATPNAIVVDEASFDPRPVSPKPSIILLASMLISLIIPISIIYIKDLFDNKLRNKEQLLNIIKAPYLGDVPLSKDTNSFPVLNVRSSIAERFRIITSNLGFIVAAAKGGKVIMITSSQSGEGKSFFSRNLAMSLATLGKRTLLIDMDMRKSYMNKTLEMDPIKGIAMFLSDPSIKVSDIIDKSKKFNKNLDIIPVKVFPPNPAELLASDRLDLLFNTLKNEYEYIIVDTAPVGLVADAYRINQFVDATIIASRADYTFKVDLHEIANIYKNNKLNNVTLVLNAVSSAGRYGYKYGYGYGYYGKKNYYTDEK